jgi:hypothetical protein
MASEDCLGLGPWLMRFRQDAAHQIPGHLPDFDYGTPIEFGFSVSVDLKRVCAETGLEDTSLVGVFLTADCQSSDLRMSASMRAEEGEHELWLGIEAGVLAGSVELRRGLVTLAENSSSGGASAIATRAGSRLFEDVPEHVVLEGNLSRFPIESTSFKSARYPAHAAWFLDVTYTDPRDPFLGGVRLVVNRDHQAGRAVLDKSDSVESKLAASILRVDIVRHLFAALAQDDRLDDLDEIPEDSVVGVAAAIASTSLSMDLDTALRMYREDPIYLEQCLQNAYRYLEI